MSFKKVFFVGAEILDIIEVFQLFNFVLRSSFSSLSVSVRLLIRGKTFFKVYYTRNGDS